MQLECNSHYFFNTKLQNMQYWCHFPIKFHFSNFFVGYIINYFLLLFGFCLGYKGVEFWGCQQQDVFYYIFHSIFIISYGCTSCQAWNSWVKLFPSCPLRKPSPKPVLCIKSVLFFFKNVLIGNDAIGKALSVKFDVFRSCNLCL